MEREQASLDFKIGIIYAKKGQKHEDEMFSNSKSPPSSSFNGCKLIPTYLSTEDGSPQFNQFLDSLGEKVDLKAWQGFRGGLPTNGILALNQAAHQINHFNQPSPPVLLLAEGSSYFTEFCGNKIMFHVSTLLPYNENDPQKLDRKRHIGNDIVSIVFYDEPDACFSPSVISSHFLRKASFFFFSLKTGLMIPFSFILDTYAVVTPTTASSEKVSYKLNVASNREVPRFGPELPSPPIFEDPKAFREFLLAKRDHQFFLFIFFKP